MISKELLNEVLNLNMWKTNSLNILVDENKVSYSGIFLGDLGYQKSSVDINIYELSHKCKEWAFKNGYWLSVRLAAPNGFNIVVFSHIHSQLQKDLKEINDKTEPNAIIKACQMILDKRIQDDNI